MSWVGQVFAWLYLFFLLAVLAFALFIEWVPLYWVLPYPILFLLPYSWSRSLWVYALAATTGFLGQLGLRWYVLAGLVESLRSP